MEITGGKYIFIAYSLEMHPFCKRKQPRVTAFNKAAENSEGSLLILFCIFVALNTLHTSLSTLIHAFQ